MLRTRIINNSSFSTFSKFKWHKSYYILIKYYSFLFLPNLIFFESLTNGPVEEPLENLLNPRTPEATEAMIINRPTFPTQESSFSPLVFLSSSINRFNIYETIPKLFHQNPRDSMVSRSTVFLLSF